MKPNRKALLQFCRYLVTGVINTLVTLFVIYVCKGILGINPWVSNAIGYVVGVINSFMWNRMWVFNSREDSWKGQGVRFIIGFLVCYGIQFAATWLMNEYVIAPEFEFSLVGFTFTGYAIATVVGMMVYTISNFIYNRLFTFRNTEL